MKLTIKNAVVITSLVLGAAFAAATSVNAVALHQLRIGGPQYNELKSDFDLLADVLPPPQYVIEPYLEATLALNDLDHSELHRQRLDELHKSFNDRKAYWKCQSLDGETRRLLDNATDTADVFWKQMDEAFLPAVARKDQAEAQKAYRSLSKAYAEHRQAINLLVAEGNKSLEISQAKADRSNTVFQAVTWILSAAVIALLIAVIYGFIRFIISPLLHFAQATESLAQGNMSAAIPALDRSDEMGDLAQALAVFRDKLVAAEQAAGEQTKLIVASIGNGLSHLAKGDLTHRVTASLTGDFAKLKTDFNAAMERLQDTVKDVLSATHQIQTGASEISQATGDLSHRTEQQAASLEETAAALEEITETVRKTASNAREASKTVAAAKAAAENGGTVVDTAVKAMDEIAQSSRQITEIISVIDEIAFQTNLLALNAGVEAARAGEAGRGFAVVASEVRALAQRSSEAAKQIKSLIGASGAQVSDGVRLVGESGRTLKQIVDQVLQINNLVSEMAKATEQQSAGIEEVNAAIGQMDQVTQQNAAMVEETTAASRSLADETHSLVKLVQFFSVEDAPDIARPRLVPERRLAIAG